MTAHHLLPIYTPDDFAPLDVDDDLADVIFEEDDDVLPPSQDDRPDDDGRAAD